ncbi:MBL fold metallo-hydrolase [Sphingomonas sp. AR_OL41]|uniref:MBL fold metallo-hydrolase n=1 Tax=Sphingomonas sp. AR_OL41 TaxID=3042729 RepID=UPI00248030C3|nr:MBL fold metallo-hydrolase [Sphingomonas sp. AR_OL41]MDH7975236.1 MBL fold metallo-hydrolase [Sphingomonas sp. AR_OL41]
MLAIQSSATTVAPAADPFTLTPIAPGVYAAIDGPAGRSGSNAGFVIGDDGVLVIDSFFDPEATKVLIADIRKLTPKPIRYVVNTHYHADHVAGDAVLRAAGAIIIAHRNVRGWVRTENLHLFGAHPSPRIAAMVTALPLPDVTIDHDLTIWLGKRKILIQPVLGHTGGDLIVTVPDAKTVYCGDILWRHVSPNIIDGDVASWLSTLAEMLHATDASDTTFVPGHGGVATARDVFDFQRYLGDLRALVSRDRDRGLSAKALIDAALPEFAQLHGDWGSFAYFAPLELGYMEDELAGRKRRPQSVVD